MRREDQTRARPAAGAFARAKGRLLAALAGKSALSLADQAVVSGTNFVAAALLGARSGMAELGLYVLGFAVLVVAVNVHASLIVAPFTFYRAHCRGNSRRFLQGSALLQHAALCAGALVVLFALAAAARQFFPSASGVLLALACASPFVLLKELARRSAFAEFNVRTALVIDSAAAAAQLGAMVALAAYGRLSAVTAHLAIGAAAIAPGAIWLALAWPQMRFAWRLAALHAKRAWRFGSWVLADQMFAVVSGYFSHWTLAVVVGPAATGAFAACLNVVQLANPLIYGMGNILEPKASAEAASGGRAGLRRLVAGATLLIGAAMAAFSVVFLLGGDWIVQRLYGEPIAADSPWLIPLLTVAALLAALNVGVIHGLRAAQRSQANLAAGVANFLATLVVAAAGIPQYGLVAAAVAMACGNGAGLIVRCFCFLRWTRQATDGRVIPARQTMAKQTVEPARQHGGEEPAGDGAEDMATCEASA